MSSCRCCGIDVVGETQRRNVEKYEIAVALLQQFYTDETLTEFGVAQKPGSTTEAIDQVWWTVVRRTPDHDEQDEVKPDD